MAFSDFDGLGHFRTALTTGDFAGGESRAVTTDYNPGNMTLIVDPDTSSTAGSTFVMPGRDDPVLTIEPPDPSLAQTVFVYRGEQRVERSDKVADISGTADFALRYSYDPANRLIAVDEVDGPGSTRPVKSFHYARANDGSDLKAGKLVLSKRVNWVDVVGPLDSGTLPVTVSQAYRYQGEGGRVSQRQTRYNLGLTHYAFTTGFAYDDLGNLRQVDYPRCLHSGCAGYDPPRTVAFDYTRGFLSSVGGFAASLSYQRGGMLHRVTHANAAVETVEVDSVHPFDRPYRMTTSGVATGGWDSGVYEYDGSGNVKQIGDQLYRYDRTSRLLEGQVEVAGELKTQAMSYDAFGNILSLKRRI